MEKYNIKKAEQLGMPSGTASSRLKKILMFELAKLTGKDICYRCNKLIETVEEFSLEHKVPWLDSANPIESFFDLNNIAFSHLSCNISDSRRRYCICGTYCQYSKGCRCEKCREANAKKVRKNRENKKTSRYSPTGEAVVLKIIQ